MGATENLTAAQLDQLRTLTRELPEIDRVVRVDGDGLWKLSLPTRSNDIVLVRFESLGK